MLNEIQTTPLHPRLPPEGINIDDYLALTESSPPSSETHRYPLQSAGLEYTHRTGAQPAYFLSTVFPTVLECC